MADRFAKLRGILCAATVLGGLGYAHPCFAQAMDLPGSADPGRVLENLELPERPDRSLEPEEKGRKAVATAPQGTENLKFVLRDLQVDGMTAYDSADLQKLYGEYLDREISVATLFEIMAALQQKYLDDGYALTKVVIPNQNIESGNVRLSVIEGHVETVEMGPGLDQTAQVRDAAQRIAAMRPLNVKKLERIMLILNDLPDLNVSAIIANDPNSARNEQGAVRLILQKNEEDVSIGSVGVDNHGSVFTGPLQIKANVQQFGLGIAHSTLALSTIAAVPFQEQKLGSVSYTVPVFGASGTMATLSASKARTEPGSRFLSSSVMLKGPPGAIRFAPYVSSARERAFKRWVIRTTRWKRFGVAFAASAIAITENCEGNVCLIS